MLPARFACILGLIIVCNAYGQFSFSPAAGINVSRFTYDYESGLSEPNAYFILSPFAGAYVQYHFNAGAFVESGVLYSVKGCGEDLDYDISNTDRFKGWQKYSLNYMEIPLFAGYKFEFKKLSFSGSAGPYIGILLSGDYSWNCELYHVEADDIQTLEDKTEGSMSIKAVDQLSPDNYSSDYTYFRKIDYGLNFGLNIIVGKFKFRMQYGLGLANLTPEYTDFGYQLYHVRGPAEIQLGPEYISFSDFDQDKYKKSNRTFTFSVAWVFRK